VGTSFNEIKFPMLLAYAEENGVISENQYNYFEFVVTLNGETYSVKATRARDGSNFAIMRSKQI
jgi:hypothetical protein